MRLGLLELRGRVPGPKVGCSSHCLGARLLGKCGKFLRSGMRTHLVLTNKKEQILTD